MKIISLSMKRKENISPWRLPVFHSHNICAVSSTGDDELEIYAVANQQIEIS